MLMVRKIVLSIVAVLTACSFALAQNKQVSGTVVDAEGNPILGAAVTVVGTTAGGQTTGVSGEFVISAPANGTLEVSFIGYKTQQVAIAGKSNIKVVMEIDTQSIDDVVVVAFGEQKKEAFTGSAKVVSSDELIKTQSSNVTDALVGKVAGVQFTSSSGRLGSGQTLTVRGIGSISAGNNPLYIVDGVPYEGDINNLNAADIESMTILKDAASNALYGARGANGVIMITTKKARAGEAVVTFDGKWGVNTKALQQYDVTDQAGEFYEMHYGALRNYQTMVMGLDAASAHAAASGVLTSGAAGGLGDKIARTLHAQGATLALTDMRAEPMEKLKAELGSNVEVFVANLTNPDDVKNLVKNVEDKVGRIDILVNNAGLTRDNLFIRMSDEDWQLVLDVNLSAGFKLAKAAVRGMMKRHFGRIIGIASVVGVTGNAGQANYSASKAGMIAMNKCLAQEVGSRGITVNSIAPGFIRTPMTDVLPEDVKAALLAKIPEGKLGEAQDIANVVAFLASDEAQYITGQTININGGMAMI